MNKQNLNLTTPKLLEYAAKTASGTTSGMPRRTSPYIADGTKAWASVRDAVKWQRYMRGDEILENEVYYTCLECQHFTRYSEEQAIGTCPHRIGAFRYNETVEKCTNFKRKEQAMDEIKPGEKYYIEVEVDSEHDANSVYVVHPHHDCNEYSGICVYKKDLISKEKSND